MNSYPPGPSDPLPQMVPHPLCSSMRSRRSDRLGGAHLEREEPVRGYAVPHADQYDCLCVRSPRPTPWSGKKTDEGYLLRIDF